MRIVGVEEPGAPAQGAGKPGVPVGDDAFELGEGGKLVLVGQVVGAQARDLDRELVVGSQQRGQVARTPRWAGSGWGGDGWGGHVTSLGWAHTGLVAGARAAEGDRPHPWALAPTNQDLHGSPCAEGGSPARDLLHDVGPVQVSGIEVGAPVVVQDPDARYASRSLFQDRQVAAHTRCGRDPVPRCNGL